MENKLLNKILEWSLCVLLAIIMALVIRYYIVTPSKVNQSSMIPTLQENERVIVSRIQRLTKKDYVRGQIIVFQAPSNKVKLNLYNPIANYKSTLNGFVENFIYNVLELNKKTYVKRIIGIAGDRVQIKDGKVYINGEVVEENYLPYGTATQNGIYNNIIVPDGCVYVLGDNRKESMDSRKFGCIPINKIDGIVQFRYWPLNKLGKIR